MSWLIYTNMNTHHNDVRDACIVSDLLSYCCLEDSVSPSEVSTLKLIRAALFVCQNDSSPSHQSHKLSHFSLEWEHKADVEPQHSGFQPIVALLIISHIQLA